MPHFHMDLYCPQTRKFLGKGALQVTSATVLASMAVLADAAVLPVPRHGGSSYKTHWSGCPFKLTIGAPRTKIHPFI